MYVPLSYLYHDIGLIADIPHSDIPCQEIVDTIGIFRTIFYILVFICYCLARNLLLI